MTSQPLPPSAVHLDADLFRHLLEQAAQSERKRSFLTLHASHQDPAQRLVIGLQPDSFVPIHRHTHAHQWELFVILHGAVDLLIFDDVGLLISRQRIEAGSAMCAIELTPNTWHTVICQQPAVFIEIKQGPFDPSIAAEIAAFSAVEKTVDAPHCLAWLQQASIGQVAPFQRISAK